MSDDHQHPRYGLIWLWLLILTLVEVAVPWLYGSIPGVIVLIGLMALAVVKAILVAVYFMHLRFERKTFVLIVSAPLVFATILVLGLLPDIALGG